MRYQIHEGVGSPHHFEQIDKKSQEVAECCNRLIKHAIVCWNYLYFEQRFKELTDPVEKHDTIETDCGSSFKPHLPRTTELKLAQQENLFEAERENHSEYLLLKGLLRSFVVDVDGKEVTVAFHQGPGVITPWMARSYQALQLLGLDDNGPGKLHRCSS